MSNPVEDGFLAPLPRAAGFKFPLGTVVGTPGALAALDAAGRAPTEYINRHRSGDWGEITSGDEGLNDKALVNGERLLSAYTLPTGVKIWIITEWDRSATTVLLPEDY